MREFKFFNNQKKTEINPQLNGNGKYFQYEIDGIIKQLLIDDFTISTDSSSYPRLKHTLKINCNLTNERRTEVIGDLRGCKIIGNITSLVNGSIISKIHFSSVMSEFKWSLYNDECEVEFFFRFL